MRRLLYLIPAACAFVALAACGNKGPLYRPAHAPVAASTTAPAPAPAPAPASTASEPSG